MFDRNRLVGIGCLVIGLSLGSCHPPPILEVVVEPGEDGVNITFDPGSGTLILEEVPPSPPQAPPSSPPVEPPAEPPPSSPPPSPPTVDLRVNNSDGPLTIESDDQLYLTWASSGAVSLLATGAWSGPRPLSGVETAGPLTVGTYLFILLATGSGGLDTDSVTVIVKPATPPPLLEISEVTFSRPAGGGDCFVVGEEVVITVKTNRDGEVHYLLADSPGIIGTLETEEGVATFTHRFPFPVDPDPPYEGRSFFWPEDRDFLPYLKEVVTCVQ